MENKSSHNNNLVNKLNRELNENLSRCDPNIILKHRIKNAHSHLHTKQIMFKKIENIHIDGENHSDLCIYIDSIEFCDGYHGKIDYIGCNDIKPNIAQDDFLVNIPVNISIFIVRATLELHNETIRCHFLIDLSLQRGNILSIVKSGNNTDKMLLNNINVMVISNLLPNHYRKSDNVSPINIYLFCNK